jgi:hypothetical protein
MKTLFCGIYVVLFIAFVFTSAVYAQSTIIKLPTTVGASSSLTVSDSNNATLMKLNADGGFCLFGNIDYSNIPAVGDGARFMWHPFKRAVRSGYTSGSQWDDAMIGINSVAMGLYTTASGASSTAMGSGTTASGDFSTARGAGTTASGYGSTAMGYNSVAGGESSTALGRNTTASADYSTAIGIYANASGYGSTALGYYTTTHGLYSTAMGNSTIANGNGSTAVGYSTVANQTASTAMGSYVKANHVGSFIIGDYSKFDYDSSSTINQMTARFNNGYRFYTSSACTTGPYMNFNDPNWNANCDRNKKENFRPIDGEELLSKIRQMPITEWNYKGANPFVKYIGPVAQDFYSAFHLGGTDSLGINSLCIDGINIAAVQALEKRTSELKTAVCELQKANEKIAQLENQLLQQKSEQEKVNAILSERIEKLSNLISSSTTNNNSPAPSVQITNNK